MVSIEWLAASSGINKGFIAFKKFYLGVKPEKFPFFNVYKTNVFKLLIF